MDDPTRMDPPACAPTQLGVRTPIEEVTVEVAGNDEPWPTHIGPYRVAGLLGAGGMGEVFAVHDPRFDRVCALKRLGPNVTSDLERELFLTEMRVTASLDHPHVVPVLDRGTDEDGRPWFVMPRLLGHPLSALLVGSDPMPLTDALAVFLKVAGAVAHAHSRGILHLDVKPQNVWVGAHGLAYLLDWGLSGAALPSWGEDAPGVGTPSYCAPEQFARDTPIDERTDVYGLGALLFSMAFRRPPRRYAFLHDDRFSAEDLEHLGERCGVHAPRVAAIIDRAMATRPADRHPSVEALLADVECIFSASPVSLLAYVEVRSGREGDYEAWAREMAEISVRFEGHQGLSVTRLPHPSAPTVTSYLLTGRFASAEHAARWVDSKERAALVARLNALGAVERARRLTAQGMDAWFAVDED